MCTYQFLFFCQIVRSCSLYTCQKRLSRYAFTLWCYTLNKRNKMPSAVKIVCRLERSIASHHAIHSKRHFTSLPSEWVEHGQQLDATTFSTDNDGNKARNAWHQVMITIVNNMETRTAISYTKLDGARSKLYGNTMYSRTGSNITLSFSPPYSRFVSFSWWFFRANIYARYSFKYFGSSIDN